MNDKCIVKNYTTHSFFLTIFFWRFGNTVTTPWWSQLYLQEGFARYFQVPFLPFNFLLFCTHTQKFTNSRIVSVLLQYVGVDSIYPKWEIFTHSGPYSFFNVAYTLSMNTDYLGVLGPVVKRDSDINVNALFDNQCLNLTMTVQVFVFFFE